jgi:hypothetical protein
MKKSASLIMVMLILFSMLCGCEIPVDSTTTKDAEATTISIPGTLVADNFTFTIVSAEIVDSVTLDSSVNIKVDAEGKQFLVLCVDATNTSEEIRNLGPFTTYVDNTTVLPHNVLGKYNDRMLMSGAVHPGKTMNTYVMYQVPMDWETFEISYMDSLTGKVSGSVKFNHSDVN